MVLHKKLGANNSYFRYNGNKVIVTTDMGEASMGAMTLGARGEGVLHGECDIGNVYLFDDAPTDNEITAIEAYENSKWAVY